MLRLGLYLEAFLLGLQHSFEPDHMAAVSVLATEKRGMRSNLIPILWRSSQWALGHGLVLLILGFITLVLKSALPTRISEIVELWVIGPVMIALGIVAIYRAFNVSTHTHTHSHGDESDVEHEHSHLSEGDTDGEHSHSHTHVSDKITIFNRSFGIGMLHGAAGTGGALAAALVVSAKTVTQAMMILVIESIGVLVAMGVYSILLVYVLKQFTGRHTIVLRIINFVVGIVSIAVGILWIYQGFFAPAAHA